MLSKGLWWWVPELRNLIVSVYCHSQCIHFFHSQRLLNEAEQSWTELRITNSVVETFDSKAILGGKIRVVSLQWRFSTEGSQATNSLSRPSNFQLGNVSKESTFQHTYQTLASICLHLPELASIYTCTCEHLPLWQLPNAVCPMFAYN